jgi:hypothetical protein
MIRPRLTVAFVVAQYFLAGASLHAQQTGGGFGTTGGTGGFGGVTGGQTGATTGGGLGGTTSGLATGGLLNQQSTFQGFTQNFGSGNSPFSTGTSSLGGGSNGIGTLAGGATGTAGSQAGRVGQTGLGGIGGSLGGLGGGLGGIGGGLGGLGGGLGGLGGGLGGIGGRGGIGGLGGFGGGLGGFGNTRGGFQGGQGGQGNQQGKANIRTTFKPAFDRPTVPVTSEDTKRVQARMERLPLPDKYRNVKVDVVGRTAILTGEVGSEAEARFIARLVSLEPGIDSIDSRLTQRGAPAEPVPAVSNP